MLFLLGKKFVFPIDRSRIIHTVEPGGGVFIVGYIQYIVVTLASHYIGNLEDFGSLKNCLAIRMKASCHVLAPTTGV